MLLLSISNISSLLLFSMTVQADLSGTCSETVLCSHEAAQISAYKNMNCHLMNSCETMQYSDIIQLNTQNRQSMFDIKYSHFDLRIIKDLTILLTLGEFIDCDTIILANLK